MSQREILINAPSLSSKEAYGECLVCPAGKQCETGSAEDCRQGYYCPEGTYQATDQCPSGRLYEKRAKFFGVF